MARQDLRGRVGPGPTCCGPGPGRGGGPGAAADHGLEHPRSSPTIAYRVTAAPSASLRWCIRMGVAFSVLMTPRSSGVRRH